MKKLFVSVLASASLFSAQAQLFSPEALGGAMWGSLIGGLAGADCHNSFSGEGAAIGAGVGLLVGALTGEARRNQSAEPAHTFTPATTVSLGYGYSQGSSAYVYYAPNNYTAPGHYYRPTRPNYAVSGTLLGAASGALIGAGNEQAGQGAAIGAAAGLVLGSVAELTANRREANVVANQATMESTQPVSTSTLDSRPQTQNARSEDLRSEVTSQPVATSTYTWTPRPQIADAPRVPDAPSF